MSQQKFINEQIFSNHPYQLVSEHTWQIKTIYYYYIIWNYSLRINFLNFLQIIVADEFCVQTVNIYKLDGMFVFM